MDDDCGDDDAAVPRSRSQNSTCPICQEAVPRRHDDDDGGDWRRTFVYVNEHGTFSIHVDEMSQNVLATGKAVCPLSRASFTVVDLVRLDRHFARYMAMASPQTIAQTHLVVRVYHPRWKEYDRSLDIHQETCDSFTELMQDYITLIAAGIQDETHPPRGTAYYLEREFPELQERVQLFARVDCAHTIETLSDMAQSMLSHFPHPKFMLVMFFIHSLIHDIALLPHVYAPPEHQMRPKPPQLEIYNGDPLPSDEVVLRWTTTVASTD